MNTRIPAVRPGQILVALCLAVSAATTGSALAQDRDRTQLRDQDRETIYGSQLMSAQERAEYRKQMRELRTAEEREQFRREHHERMQERARDKGVQLPAEPPAQAGRGLQPGNSPGTGPRASAGGGAGAGGRGR